MPLIDQIQKDMVDAMKAKEEARLSCLRMVKTALKNKEIEKMAPLDDKESQQVLSTLIKQRKDSIEQFTKGGRQAMADREAAEITLIETYLPKAAGEAEIVAGVKAAIAGLFGLGTAASAVASVTSRNSWTMNQSPPPAAGTLTAKWRGLPGVTCEAGSRRR